MIGYLLSVLYNNSTTAATSPSYPVSVDKIKFDDTDFMKLGGYIISEKDLKSVKLTPPLPPLTSAGMIPFSKVDMRHLNKDQLDSIMSVKLRPTPKVHRLPYEIRHPCLRELLRTRQIIH
jgi:hypothetical protein